mmetsp:Transcript_71360/g.128444  ORF Transcript_71360/g.128444 Transcript_71360/m.128444 type:complete len:200 (+) Transcript_71360:2950-3549(+)
MRARMVVFRRIWLVCPSSLSSSTASTGRSSHELESKASCCRESRPRASLFRSKWSTQSRRSRPATRRSRLYGSRAPHSRGKCSRSTARWQSCRCRVLRSRRTMTMRWRRSSARSRGRCRSPRNSRRSSRDSTTSSIKRARAQRRSTKLALGKMARFSDWCKPRKTCDKSKLLLRSRTSKGAGWRGTLRASARVPRRRSS